jgi:hypothetical protein
VIRAMPGERLHTHHHGEESMKATHFLRIAALAGALAVVGCNDDDDPVTPGALTVAVSPTDLTVAAGATSTMTTTIARTGSFTGAVALTVTGAPTGATIAFANSSIGANELSTQGTISLLATTTPGTYPITVTASGSGVTNQTTTFNLIVTAAPSAIRIATPTRPVLRMAPRVVWRSASLPARVLPSGYQSVG